MWANSNIKNFSLYLRNCAKRKEVVHMLQQEKKMDQNKVGTAKRTYVNVNELFFFYILAHFGFLPKILYTYIFKGIRIFCPKRNNSYLCGNERCRKRQWIASKCSIWVISVNLVGLEVMKIFKNLSCKTHNFIKCWFEKQQNRRKSSSDIDPCSMFN